jgi:hypothetical protein
MPLLLTGPDFSAILRLRTLPIQAFMVLLLIFMNTFFYINYRLLSLLEREDWPALAFYLENQIFTKSRYSNQNVRLLANSYLVLSDYPSVLKLESKVMQIKPYIIDKNILIFGISRLLSSSHEETAAFFKTHIDKNKGKDNQWVHWFYGFSQLLCGAYELAEQEFSLLAVSSDNVFITGLSAYFLQNFVAKNSRKNEECRTIAENGRKRVLKAYNNIQKWQNEANNMRTDVFISVIMNYINQTGKWLYNSQE